MITIIAITTMKTLIPGHHNMTIRNVVTVIIGLPNQEQSESPCRTATPSQPGATRTGEPKSQMPSPHRILNEIHEHQEP
jgi:hypothetical protein